jgi:hypothetical protein
MRARVELDGTSPPRDVHDMSESEAVTVEEQRTHGVGQ